MQEGFALFGITKIGLLLEVQKTTVVATQAICPSTDNYFFFFRFLFSSLRASSFKLLIYYPSNLQSVCFLLDNKSKSATMPSTNGSNDKSTQGININDAMSILTSRAKSGGEKDALQAATPELKKLGQTLDLMNTQQWTRSANDNDASNCCDTSDINETEEKKSKANADRSDGNAGDDAGDSTKPKPDTDQASKLQQELSKQSPPQLLSTLFKLQKERVAVYSEFNAGLDIVLQSGNLTSYPHLTASITASFMVISNSIKIIQQLLQKGGKNDIAGFIQQLQLLEKEKLNLSAALHLEKIRERNESLNETDGNGDERILSLLKKGVVDLEKKIASCVEDINEVLEELRYAGHDLEE